VEWVGQGQDHPAAGRGVLDGVVQEVGQGLGQEVAVAGHGDAPGQGHVQGEILFLGQRFVEFGHVGGQGGQVGVLEVLAAGAGLGLGDGQQGVEDLEHVVDGADGVFDDAPVFLGGLGGGQGEFEAGADAV